MYAQTNYGKVLFIKSRNVLTCFGSKQLCLIQTSSPTLENNPSEGTEVPGTECRGIFGEMAEE